VVPFGFLNCFEVGCPSSSCRGKESRIKPACLRGAEGAIVSSSELREEVGPPGLRPEGNPFYRGVEGQLGRYPVQVCFEPDVLRPGGRDGRGRRDTRCLE